jgi:hypothetical protein
VSYANCSNACVTTMCFAQKPIRFLWKFCRLVCVGFLQFVNWESSRTQCCEIIKNFRVG